QGQVPQQQRNRLDDLAIRGKLIISNSREADERVEVRLEKTTMQVIQTTYTDSAGGFEFRGLAPGSYFISISVEGYEPVHQQVEIFNSFGNSSVNIFMSKSSSGSWSRVPCLLVDVCEVISLSRLIEYLQYKAVQ